MSRAAVAKPASVMKYDSRKGTSGGPDDICPVCKSSRYLNTRLRLLVNPECYHKMCESCVDRIFSHGPAPCPISGCPATLRKHAFRQQTFEDIQVEREVDIRKRVSAVFNRREEDFESLRDYNDYLNEVEDITFNLVNLVDVEATEKRFEAYRRQHEQEIIENANLAEGERSYADLQKQEREQARLRREVARREEAEERKELEENRREVLSRLASGQDAEKVAKETQRVTLKKRMDRAAAAERQRQLHAASAARNGSGGVTIKGLRSKKLAEPEAPIDPFGGLSFDARKYFAPQDDYIWAGVQETKGDAVINAGGYDVAIFTGRALCEAFAGLGVFLADEMTERAKTSPDSDVITATGVKIDDPF